MRSPRKAYQERVRDLSSDGTRFADLGARVRVYRRDPRETVALPLPPVAAEWLPDVYGGRFDRLAGRYVGAPEDVKELRIHPGQVRFLAELDGEARRVLGLGSPGGGKSLGLVTAAVLYGLEHPCSVLGMVAPTRDRLDLVWRKLLDVVQPLGWVEDVRPGSREVRLRNATVYQFVSAKRQSSATGSPIAGRDWHAAFEDEQQHIDDASLREVDARGRINPHFRVFSSATNENLHEFQVRLQEYEAQAGCTVVRFTGPDNSFTSLRHWEELKRSWSPDDYRRIVECLAVPAQGRVYPQFDYGESTSPVPAVGRDLTGDVVRGTTESACDYVVGTDFGRLTTASVLLKCFAGREPGERLWYALDEVTTRDRGTDWHAAALRRWFEERGLSHTRGLVIGDPHTTAGKDADRSDYTIFRQAGFNTVRSNFGMRIDRKHRFAMVNALLRDATGRRRLFLAAAAAGGPKARRLAESLGHLKYAATGEPEAHGKDYRDLTHWSDALGYGLFLFERFRGGEPPQPDAAGGGAGPRGWALGGPRDPRRGAGR